MRTIITLLLTVITVIAFGQNGGQAPENNSVKIEYIGNGKTHVYNKQSCYAVVSMKYNHTDIKVSIAPGSYYELLTPVSGKITAKTMTNCGGADLGVVEFNLILNVLPVKFISFVAKPLTNREVEVAFEIGEAQNVDRFNVQVSLDGLSWQTVSVIFPDPIQPNKVYKTKFFIPNSNK